MRTLLLVVTVLIVSTAYGQVEFNSFADLKKYAEAKSIALKNGTLRYAEGKKQQVLAIYQLFEPTGGVTATFTNNTRLPLTPIPSNDGSGDFNLVPFGTQYQTLLNAYVEVRLLNASGIQHLKLSKLNTRVIELQTLMTKKDLMENLATAYYNVVKTQAQIEVAKTHVTLADSLLKLTNQKLDAGLVSTLAVNDAKANLLTQQHTLLQTQLGLALQYIALKTLADIPEEDSIAIRDITEKTLEGNIVIAVNNLSERLVAARQAYNSSLKRKRNLALMPNLSAFASGSRQQFNTGFSIANPDNQWIPSSYIGLRLNFTIPSPQTLAARISSHYDDLVEQNNLELAQQQTALAHERLFLDQKRAEADVQYHESLYRLEQDTYGKKTENYRAGIAGIDTVLDTFLQLTTQAYAVAAARADIHLMNVKIKINNEIE